MKKKSIKLVSGLMCIYLCLAPFEVFAEDFRIVNDDDVYENVINEDTLSSDILNEIYNDVELTTLDSIHDVNEDADVVTSESEEEVEVQNSEYEEDKIEEVKVEEDKVEEDKVEEDKVEEDKVEEDKVEEVTVDVETEKESEAEFKNTNKSDKHLNSTVTKEMNFDEYNQFVTISKKDEIIWNNLNWEEKGSTTSVYGKVYLAKESFLYNNVRYLSLYDHQSNWFGYVEEVVTELADGEVGIYQEYGKHVTITKKNEKFWNNFNWEAKGSTNSVYGKVYLAKGYYEHYNGSRYLSVYDNKNNWLGYINEKSTQLSTNQSGIYQAYGKYVTIIKKNEKFWKNFNWEAKSSTNSVYGNTYLAKGYYEHYNGSRYLSIYDNNNKWLGYINEKSTELNKTLVEMEPNNRYYVTITNKNFDILLNLNGVKKNHTKNYYMNDVRVAEHHVNSKNVRYLSIYSSSNEWIGYVDERATNINAIKLADSNTDKQKNVHVFVMGHGNRDPGAGTAALNERDFTRNELLPYLRKYAALLKNSTIEFYNTKANMYNDTQNGHGARSISNNVLSVTEIHLDASVAAATGGHVIVNKRNGNTVENNLIVNVLRKNSSVWAGVSKTNGLSYRSDLLNLNVFERRDIPYRLIELGFITNASDVAKLRRNMDQMAKELIESVTGEVIK